MENNCSGTEFLLIRPDKEINRQMNGNVKGQQCCNTTAVLLLLLREDYFAMDTKMDTNAYDALKMQFLCR